MSHAWAEFARSGRPSHGELPEWPAYDLEERALMVFDDECLVARKLDTALLTALPDD
jgi:para-nitrobenzyl esterase